MPVQNPPRHFVDMALQEIFQSNRKRIHDEEGLLEKAAER